MPEGMNVRMPVLALALLPVALAARVEAAQLPPGWSLEAGASAIPLLTHASPAPGGEAMTEGYLTQPLLMAHASGAGGRLSLEGMLNLEGVTLQRGELNAGVWGEGYVDRRHPHTYLHELMGSARLAGPSAEGPALSLSLAAGRGFAPFGTDDPMSRPMVKFPANHHLSHLLERYVAIAALRVGPMVAEIAAFNGNEPAGARDLAGLGRFGDSWSSRVSVRPLAGLELQGSHARVEAPELPPSSESEHRKWSASARVERGGAYALVEWARTGEYFSGVRAHDFRTALAEAAVRRGVVEVAARYERTTRPEEERLLDPFRTAVPHTDVHLLGVTRWSIVSGRAAAARALALGPVRARPFLEGGSARVEKVLPTQVFDPVEFYGSGRMWNLSIGVRLEAGMPHGRMGRYGEATERAPAGGSGRHDAGHH